MDGGTFALILVLIIAIAAAAFIIVRNYQAEEPPAAEQVSAPAPNNQRAETVTTATAATADWMYPRGAFDALSEKGRKSARAAYSLRHLWSGYKGAVVRVRRLGDGQRENFYADKDGGLYTKEKKSLKNWLKEYNEDTVAMVDIWYDQSGSKQDTEVERSTSETRIEPRDDGRRPGWQIRFSGTDVIKIGAANRNNPLQDYADFTIVLNAKWEDRSWATALWIGPPGNDSSPSKTAVFIGNFASSGRYSFMYGGKMDEKQVVSKMKAVESDKDGTNIKKAPFTNFIMVGKKAGNKSEVRGYINGSGFNSNTSDVVYSGPPPENIRSWADGLYLGGHTNMTGGQSKPIVGKVTDLILFAEPLLNSDWQQMSSYNN